ncbi:MAG: bifunctional 2-C-methyl-D-erythritol 4-phosphate cytidylyltransferase/2-C-methyl-D-erythritol 2,4-cyclodiphosphate synthase [Defluviicoccus sp.]|nr:bifunctional 2-C-methyl-D-erythritol 4-phosphate cytidylyltransferase/2-C-methyl-D-erythritol 2,4-cyclodiphosphate synthase [Defluviicoccus sp.]MDE0385259.1 bifunctional 2-C-methyl-D-erythritol 4-phosphate cytidylyltransferase/2-C-methyl-D-erythritol 2,4-cyclodiphosphate synthase [Defluviicoccus sp.]
MTGCVALILAGGRGTRLGAALPKQYLPLGDAAVLRHAVSGFVDHTAVDRVRVVIGAGDREECDRALDGLDLLEPVAGGETRQDSARLGLESLVPVDPQTVLIHDAARPFADAATISRVLAALETRPAALPAVPVSDTLKRERGGVDAPLVGATVERRGLWHAQTPQGFRFAEILAAHRAAAGMALTDDAAVAEQAGLEVALVHGSDANVKVTTPEDLERARRWLGGEPFELRTGTGFDVHRFGEGEAVTLCGVEIPHDRALAGHSDADVGMHALTDALLGAISEGDIGLHFPPTDPRWRGEPSATFLCHAARLVRRRGGSIVNLDLTLICETPKIAPHRDAMAARVAALLELEPGRIGIKATTTEGLGFTGRGEGIAAQAVATIRLPA